MPLVPARKINLLSLTNGVLDNLVTSSLDAGHYSQVRLGLDANTSGTANTVVPTGTTTELALDTPSTVSVGLKVNGSFDITAGATTSLAIDFDACRSVASKGNGSYALRPVLACLGARVVVESLFVADGQTDFTDGRITLAPEIRLRLDNALANLQEAHSRLISDTPIIANTFLPTFAV